jgi:hypothetical protein
MSDSAVFRVSIQGILDDNWSSYFGMRSVLTETDEAGVRVTTFVTEAVDQSALVGLINRLSSLGLPLLAVECLSIE